MPMCAAAILGAWRVQGTDQSSIFFNRAHPSMLIEPIDVLSEPPAPGEEALAPDAPAPVADISPLPEAMELLPAPSNQQRL